MRSLACMPYLAVEVSAKNRLTSASHLADDVLEVRLAVVVVKRIYADAHAPEYAHESADGKARSGAIARRRVVARADCEEPKTRSTRRGVRGRGQREAPEAR